MPRTPKTEASHETELPVEAPSSTTGEAARSSRSRKPAKANSGPTPRTSAPTARAANQRTGKVSGVETTGPATSHAQETPAPVTGPTTPAVASDEARYSALAEKLASVMTAAGFPPMPARVQMALVFSADGALTSAELEERLSISPAAVSGAANWLSTVGFVSRRTQPGSRRKLITLTDEAWFTVSFRQATTYNAIEGVLAEALDDPVNPDSIGSDRMARLTELRDFFDFMKRRMPTLLEEWRAER